MKSILDRSFRYTPASQTDLKKTFARIRRKQSQRLSQKAEFAVRAENVAPLRRKAA